jgi:hypothetical protein
VREHDGDAWQSERALPRSRAVKRLTLVGSERPALLSGDRTCPTRKSSGFTEQLASDGSGFWFAGRVGSQLYLSHLAP